MMVSGKMIKKMVMVTSFGKMAIDIREIGKKIILKESVKFLILNFI